jgi:hypothetical protein
MAALIVFVVIGMSHADTEQRSVRSFDGVHASGSVKVYLTEGRGGVIRITAEGIEPEQVVTEVTGNRLEVKPKSGILIGGDTEIIVEATYTSLRELISNNGAEIYGRSTLRGDGLVIEAKNYGKAKVDIDVDSLSCTVISGGELTVSGRTKDLEAVVNKAGQLHGFELISDNVFVQIGTAGFAEVYASDLIEGTVKSAGGLRFRGEPNKERIETSGGGKAKPVD